MRTGRGEWAAMSLDLCIPVEEAGDGLYNIVPRPRFARRVYFLYYLLSIYMFLLELRHIRELGGVLTKAC